VPDLSNVYAVVIPSGTTVTFNNAVNAQAGTVNMTTLNGGSLTMTNGALSASTVNVENLNTSAGTQLTTSGGITVAPTVNTTSTIAGVLAGAGGFSKNGAGTVALNGANTYSGATSINAGTLSVAGSLSDITSVSVASGATYNLSASDTIAAIAGAGAINLNTNTLTVNGAVDSFYSGVMSGAGSLVKSGSHTLTLSGANAYTGATTINAGVLNVTGSLSDNTDVSIASGATYSLGMSDTIARIRGAGAVNLNTNTLTVNGSVDSTYSGVMSGTGGLVKSGSHTLTLSGANTFGGLTNVAAGTLVIANNNALGSVAGATSVANGATLDLQNVAVGAEQITLSGGVLSNSTGTSSLAGNVVLASNSTIAVSGAELEISGQLSGVTRGFNKTGAGRLALSGNNRYTGTTYIDAGTVLVRGLGSLGSAGSNLSVAAGAILDLQTNLTVGSLSMAGSALIDHTAGTSSLTVNSLSSIAGVIKTTGNQTYNADVELAGSATIQTQGGNISFNGTVTAPGNSKSARNSLALDASAGNVTFNGRVGETPVIDNTYRNFATNSNLYNLTVTAGKIFINADVTTMEQQRYNGSVVIGGSDVVRTLLSLDPVIYFNGTVDDATANTHKLVARAVSVATPGSVADVPKVIFERAVGSVAPLMGLEAITGIQSVGGAAKVGDVDPAASLNPYTMVGQVVVKGSVTTLQDQTYVANAMEFGGADPKLTLTTKSGIINVFAGQNINHPILPGVATASGTQIALKGKVGKEAAASFKLSGVKFSEDSKGGYEAAQFLKELTGQKNEKKALTGKAVVEVGEAKVPECNDKGQQGKCAAN
jgi:autotransporter-associated beta strand protein